MPLQPKVYALLATLSWVAYTHMMSATLLTHATHTHIVTHLKRTLHLLTRPLRAEETFSWLPLQGRSFDVVFNSDSAPISDTPSRNLLLILRVNELPHKVNLNRGPMTLLNDVMTTIDFHCRLWVARDEVTKAILGESPAQADILHRHTS